MTAFVANILPVSGESSADARQDRGFSPDELAQRVAVLQRFRDLLIQQRDRFRSYLAVLENQQIQIESGNVEQLLTYVELEEHIIADIFSIQKVINPLENMLHGEDDDVFTLKATLEELKVQAIARSAHNRELLSVRMGEIRAEIKALRNNPLVNLSRSLYHHSGTASLIDITG